MDFAAQQLKATLEGLAKHLFGDVECRWVDAYFPFTEPSFELEIFFEGDWLEVLGCGVTQQAILDANGNAGNVAWAFGLGLERLAMVLFDIPDIRHAVGSPARLSVCTCADAPRGGKLHFRACEVIKKQALNPNLQCPALLCHLLCVLQRCRRPLYIEPWRAHWSPADNGNLLSCRLFWSDDRRFLDQFQAGDLRSKFKPFSKYPPVFKDIAFWITDDFTENNLAEIVRSAGVCIRRRSTKQETGAALGSQRSVYGKALAFAVHKRRWSHVRAIGFDSAEAPARHFKGPTFQATATSSCAGGDLVEEVKLIDEFENRKKGRTSNCFRIAYRSMERSLTDEEINAIQNEVRSEVASRLGVELR